MAALAAVDNPLTEKASAFAKVTYKIIDTCRDIVLDTFSLFSGVSTSGEAFSVWKKTAGFNPLVINFELLEALGELPDLSEQGIALEGQLAFVQYARYFGQSTHLQIVQVSQSLVEVEAVPEPTTMLGSALFAGLLGYGRKLRNKFSAHKSKVAEPME